MKGTADRKGVPSAHLNEIIVADTQQQQKCFLAPDSELVAKLALRCAH